MTERVRAKMPFCYYYLSCIGMPYQPKGPLTEEVKNCKQTKQVTFITRACNNTCQALGLSKCSEILLKTVSEFQKLVSKY